MGRAQHRRRQNPSGAAIGWGIAALLALLTLGTAGVALIKTHSNPPVEKAKMQALANKWGPVFGVTPLTVMSIGKIESGFKPDTVNYSVRSIPLGGAWGPWQMTQSTANDWAKKLGGSTNAEVRAIAARWKGDGKLLTTDLELAAVFSIAFLGALAKKFNHNFTLVAGAYHQGAGKISQMLKDKEPIPSQLPPKGKEYVAMALAAQKSLAA